MLSDAFILFTDTEVFIRALATQKYKPWTFLLLSRSLQQWWSGRDIVAVGYGREEGSGYDRCIRPAVFGN